MMKTCINLTYKNSKIIQKILFKESSVMWHKSGKTILDLNNNFDDEQTLYFYIDDYNVMNYGLMRIDLVGEVIDEKELLRKNKLERILEDEN